MAVYKVPQNVEAEDKIIGWLGIRQLIYAAIGFGFGYVTYLGFRANIALGIIPLMPTMLFLFLAFYKKSDQPVESYLAALVRFYLVPRKRLWVPGSALTYVKVTAPKKAPGAQRNPYEVKDQLKRISDILDTRGWASKRAEITLPDASQIVSGEERLVLPHSQDAVSADITQSEDILDDSNQLSQEMEQLSQKSAQIAKQSAIERMQKAMKQPANKSDKTDKDTEDKLNKASIGDVKDVHYDPYPSGIHQKVLKPTNSDAILDLANQKDLKVDQIAAQAARINNREEKQD